MGAPRGLRPPLPPCPRGARPPPAAPTGRPGAARAPHGARRDGGAIGPPPGLPLHVPSPPHTPERGERQRIEVPPSGRSAGLARPLLPGGSGRAPGCCLTCAPGEPGRSAAGSVRCPRAAPALPPGPAARPRPHARPPHPAIGAAGRRPLRLGPQESRRRSTCRQMWSEKDKAPFLPPARPKTQPA